MFVYGLERNTRVRTKMDAPADKQVPIVLVVQDARGLPQWFVACSRGDAGTVTLLSVVQQ